MKKISRLITSILIAFIILFPSFSIYGFAANRLMYENFDDQSIDSGIVVYRGGWVKLSPPQYNLDQVGRGGTGYCFRSGTVAEANLSWEKNLPVPNWPTDEMYVSFWMRYPTYTYSASMENFKFFYPHWNATQSYVHYTAADNNSVYYSYIYD